MKLYALNDTVHELLSAFATNPRGSLLITGPVGSGLTTAIKYLTSSMYGRNPRVGETLILQEGTIDAMRTLVRQVSQTRSNPTKPRLVIIDDADKLTIEAQNALLKNLEEPANKTHFVLATSSPGSLLGTITSRCRVVKLRRPSEHDLREIFIDASDHDFDQAYAIADGWPGALREILESKESTIKDQVQISKAFLGMTALDRQLHLRKNDGKEYLSNLLEGLVRVSAAAMRSSIAKSDSAGSRKWMHIVVTTQNIRKDLHSGISQKLLASKLSLEL